MNDTFSQVLLFQVKPDKTDEFEALVGKIREEQKLLPGCVSVKYLKRFYTFDRVENGKPPRALSKVVKCVKYYAFLEFDTIGNCGSANGWFFDNYAKAVCRLLIAPFDINSGYSLQAETRFAAEKYRLTKPFNDFLNEALTGFSMPRRQTRVYT